VQAVDKALGILETVRRAGFLTTTVLAMTPGWNRITAHRFLDHLAKGQWLERVTDPQMGKQSKYVLGRKALDMGGDLRI
jgi:DNA-binding IclR family transcriptional regulator